MRTELDLDSEVDSKEEPLEKAEQSNKVLGHGRGCAAMAKAQGLG